MAGVPPAPASRSFADVLGASSKDASFIKPASLHRGEPALVYTKEEVISMSVDLKFTLVGKFSRGRPPMESLRKSFLAFDFKGSFNLGLLDSRHILIRVALEEDYLRLRLRKFFNFDGFVMRLFKWTPQFRLDVESTWVPVWVRFDHLPLYLFNKGSLFSLGRILGEPLKIDAATTSLSRPSTARICVDLDLMKQQPTRVWIDDGDGGFWQPIEYEDMPKYCLSCFKVGHSLDNCLRRKAGCDKETGVRPNQIWIPKASKEQSTEGRPLTQMAAKKSSMEVLIAEAKSASTAAVAVEGDAAVAVEGEAAAVELAVAAAEVSNPPQAVMGLPNGTATDVAISPVMSAPAAVRHGLIPAAAASSAAADSVMTTVHAADADAADAAAAMLLNPPAPDATAAELEIAAVAAAAPIADSPVFVEDSELIAEDSAEASNQNLAPGAAAVVRSTLVAPIKNAMVPTIDDEFMNFSPIPRPMSLKEPIGNYPTRAQIFKNLKESHMHVMRLNIPKAQDSAVAHLSTALVPMNNVVEATPLASIAPSQLDSSFVEDGSFQSHVQSGDFCDYTDDFEVESSYYQPLTPYRGRGKKKEIVALSHRVLRPRKKTSNKS